LGRNLQGLAAVKTIVNESILERRRKLATSRNLRGARRNGTLVVQLDGDLLPVDFALNAAGLGARGRPS